MALSMIQFSLKSEIVERLIRNPEDRSTAMKKLVEQLGGKLFGFYFAFGDYDGVIIAELPDNVSALALVMAAFSAGGTTRVKTIVLISVEEAMAAMKKASAVKVELPTG